MRKIFLLLAACAAAFSLYAKEESSAPKIAVIDMGRVFDNYNKTKINEAKLKKQAEIFKDYSDNLSKSLEKLKEEFVKLRDASQNVAFSAAERENRRLNAQEKYRQVMAKEQELREYNQEKQSQLRDEYEKLRNGILTDISNVVSAKCLAEGYVLVLDKSGRTLNNIPFVVYSSNAMDITTAVIKTLNMGQTPPAAQEPNKGTPEK